MLSSQDMWDMPFSLPLADVAAREGDASEGRPRTVTHWAAHICYAIIAFVFKIAFRYSTVGLGNLRRLHGVSG
ncbi:MAG: 1-acyl-sn-glycerol-3-phosphate acyltransferase, partial [Slackia sp.]|nr:1-acyl-sn-glycerol-3-phosphate acyltransferase [Slackia sp.]